MTASTFWVRLCLVVLAALIGTSCSTEDEPPGSDPEESVSIAAPPLRACYRLVVADGLKLSNTKPPTSCNRRHTSVTVGVGRIKKTSSGRRLAVQSADAQQQIARRCKATVDAHVGGSREDKRLSRVQAVWFSPTRAQSAAGARWFRCDLVVAGDRVRFAALPRRTRGLLDKAGSQRYSTCGTAAPGASDFTRVACSARHTWRARASIDLPEGARFLGPGAGKRADAACRDIEARRDITATRLRWSFEWPTKAQWAGGQRYGLCWTPDP